MTGLYYLIIFVFGACIGSFLNCVIYRMRVSGRPRREASFLRGKSFCPKCNHKLKWYDLIPILSFIGLRARCRYCRKKISWQYPLVEISTGLIFLLFIIYYLSFISFLYLAIISCFLIIIFVYDLKHYIIPDEIIYPAIGIALIFNFGSILSAVGAGGFFFLLWLISRGKWMGFGDVKLGFLMGLLLGFPNILVALFLAFLLGAVVGLGLIFAGKKKLKSQLPFGPFLVTGTFIALFWAQAIIKWYMFI